MHTIVTLCWHKRRHLFVYMKLITFHMIMQDVINYAWHFLASIVYNIVSSMDHFLSLVQTYTIWHWLRCSILYYNGAGIADKLNCQHSDKDFLDTMLNCRIHNINHKNSWQPCWRHEMEIFTALLALCVGNSLVTGEFPAQRPVMRSFDVSLICVWINGWVSNHKAGNLRRHRAHYDVTVMQQDKLNILSRNVQV